MPTPPIRTITLGVADPHPLTFATIKRVAAILQDARTRYMEAGYEVQTVRLSTRPVFDDMMNWSSTDLLDYTPASGTGDEAISRGDAGGIWQFPFCHVGLCRTWLPILSICLS